MIKLMLKYLIDLGVKYIFLIFATVLKITEKSFVNYLSLYMWHKNELKTL